MAAIEAPEEVVLPATTDLLRLSTAGSVDDGKSTLIGRLLYDTRTVLQDQLAAVEATSFARGDGRLDLALLTDGLRAEREQGITIDVAHRYFTTARRRFVIADTPGHVQYTRNMVTGASTADLAIVLVDARRGLTEQSRRHVALAALLRIEHVVVAVNKMDLVGWSQVRFDAIVLELSDLAAALGVGEVTFVPVSALRGDNVVEPSADLAWYEGPTLLEHLERVQVGRDDRDAPSRFPVQWVVRPASGTGVEARRYAGTVARGTLRAGDRVVVLPGGRETTVAAVETADGPLVAACAGEAVTVRLADELDVSRGSVIAAADDPPTVSRRLEAVLAWMGDQPLQVRGTYLLKHGTRSLRVRVEEVRSRLDLGTGRHEPDGSPLAANDLGVVQLRAADELAYDPYEVSRGTGSCVLIDEASDATVAAGMLR
jgi:sulfate adenylyltransferase large subunit